MKRLFATFASSLLVFASPALAASAQGDVIIRHVTIIDVEAAKTVAGQAVVLKGDDIVAVGADAVIAKGWRAGRTIEGKGRYLIPGLWDMHVHFGGGPELIEENKALLPLYVANGITTIRDCSGDLPEQVLAWRNEIASGSLFGPRLLTSGAKIEGIAPVWKGTIEVGSAADVDAALDRLKTRDKVDFVKITDSTLKPELFLYALTKAKALGLRTSGHIPMALTVDQAVDAGISSVEHLDYAYNAGAKDEAAIAADFAAKRIDRAEANRRLDAGFDPDTAMAAYRRFAAKGVFVTPTLNGSRIIAYLDRDDHSKDAALQYIGKGLRATYEWRVQRAAQDDAAAIAQRKAVFEKSASLLPILASEGVSIIAGTDAGFLNSYDYPGQALHDEIGLYVQYGLTPAQALQTAVVNGPRFLGKLDRYGSLEASKSADLLVLDANPLQDIAATRKIRTVVSRGQVYDRARLDKMLADTKSWVAVQ